MYLFANIMHLTKDFLCTPTVVNIVRAIYFTHPAM